MTKTGFSLPCASLSQVINEEIVAELGKILPSPVSVLSSTVDFTNFVYKL